MKGYCRHTRIYTESAKSHRKLYSCELDPKHPTPPKPGTESPYFERNSRRAIYHRSVLGGPAVPADCSGKKSLFTFDAGSDHKFCRPRQPDLKKYLFQISIKCETRL
jgi:hypothetical protein